MVWPAFISRGPPDSPAVWQVCALQVFSPRGSIMIAPTETAVPSNAPHPKNFTPLVKQFLDYLKLEKHFSDYTIKSYGADLIQFGQFMAGEIGHANASATAGTTTPMTLEQVDERQLKCEPLTIREFLAYLYAQNYTKSTTARKLATLRCFFKFLI